MDKEELIAFLKENLFLRSESRRIDRHEVETTITLKLGDEVITETTICHE